MKRIPADEFGKSNADGPGSASRELGSLISGVQPMQRARFEDAPDALDCSHSPRVTAGSRHGETGELAADRGQPRHQPRGPAAGLQTGGADAGVMSIHAPGAGERSGQLIHRPAGQKIEPAGKFPGTPAFRNPCPAFPAMPAVTDFFSRACRLLATAPDAWPKGGRKRRSGRRRFPKERTVHHGKAF